MTTVALVSDVHMRDAHAEAVDAELEAVVRDLAAADPAHVFVLGDLIEDGESAARDAANVEAVRERLSSVGVPVTYLLGNHDVERLDRSRLSDLLGQASFYGVEDVEGTPFVYLDSPRERGGGPCGEFGAAQRRWLRETLPDLTDPIVVTHHPVGDFDLSENVWFRAFPERAFPCDRKELLAVLEDGARGTISGHVHDTAFTRFSGLPHVSVNAFGKERPDLPVTGTYALVEVGRRVEVDVRTRDGTRAVVSFE